LFMKEEDMDRSFVQRNRASTERLQKLVTGLTDAQMQHPVGADWTVAIALAHLAFWDRRVQFVLDGTERDGKLFALEVDTLVNDVLLPTWAAVPGREAARLAVETATALDKRLEAFPAALLEQVNAHNPRWVLRALHREEHLAEVEQALRK
jgi:hypothetical protein